MGLSAEQAVAMARGDLDQCETLLRESFASLGVAQATVLEEFRNRLDGDTLDDIGTTGRGGRCSHRSQRSSRSRS